MQNQNTFDPNQDNTQAGGYNNFYGANPETTQPVFPPNQSFNPSANLSGDPTQSYDPNAFYNQTQGGLPPYNADPNIAGGMPRGFTQPPLYDPNQIPAPIASNSTFEEPKSGNRFLVIGVVVLILILIGVAAYIVFNYKDQLFNNPNSTPETSQSTDNKIKTDTAPTITDNKTNPDSASSTASCLSVAPTKLTHTDPNETPAQKAKTYNETNVSCDWLKRSFAGKPGSVDQITGACLKAEICGLTVDPDGDGLTNIQEFNYQTDPLSADTDTDKIADGDEVNVYNTDPNKNDSDGDTFVDSVELGNCYDPMINSKTLPANDITGGKLTISRQNDIKNKIVINPLHEPTITMLKATTDPSAVTSGFAKCAPTSAVSPTDPATTPATTPTTAPVNTPSTTPTTSTPTAPATKNVLPN